MARASSGKGQIPVESFQHDETRSNIPTADAAATFYDEEADALAPLRYPRDPSRDPQLVWRGKDEQDDVELIVDAPPIYIQEKIDPRALVENLRKNVKSSESEAEPTLFDAFDDLEGLDQVEYYQHEESWKNRMILGDSLQVMGSLAERESLRGKVQMAFIDPPYGIRFNSNWQARTSSRDVKDGNLRDAAREAEQIKAFRDTWAFGIHSYLSYLRDRLVVARDLLTESGSVFVQIGDENVHRVRSLLDEIFGADNLVAQIAFTKTSGLAAANLPAVIDYVLWYAKDISVVKYRQLYETKSLGGRGSGMYSYAELGDGTRRRLTAAERAGETPLPDGARAYRLSDFTSPRVREARTGYYEIEVGGRKFLPNKGEWKTHREGTKRLLMANRLEALGSTPAYVRFVDDFPAFSITNSWLDVGGASDRIYVVQTSTKIIERCMQMSTDPGDLVLDPTCGSGTTAHVAEQWGRRWITIDTSRVALALARQRIMGAKYPYYSLADSDEGRKSEGLPPAKTTHDVRKGFVYKKVQHISLRSIANNPDIKEGMSRQEIDAAIVKHADFELLYDQPLEDKTRVRVAGPFTVESLSPHRSLSFDEADKLRTPDEDHDQQSFEQSIIDNLRTAGIQNGRRNERLQFAALESFAGEYLQAVGDRLASEDDDSNAPERVAISIGPQYGTVGPGFIKAAVREAVKAEIGLVAILGFAFDPLATGVTESDGVTVVAGEAGFATVQGQRTLGRAQVLFVRMNVDLLMGTELKKTSTGNLFTIFGEPDIEVRDEDGKVVVELKGVDVYDPTSGDVRSNSTGEIALWMLDTDYNEESFFVRHAYFTGDNDPFKQLKAALKADIDPAAWAALYRTTSVPFDTPSTGKIAVKVINDYGDEVMKVIEVN